MPHYGSLSHFFVNQTSRQTAAFNGTAHLQYICIFITAKSLLAFTAIGNELDRERIPIMPMIGSKINISFNYRKMTLKVTARKYIVCNIIHEKRMNQAQNMPVGLSMKY